MGIHSLLPLLLVTAQPAAVEPPAPPPPVIDSSGRWNPGIGYVTAGQDEPGYRLWYMASAERAAWVKSLNDYLVTYGVGGIVPTWQLIRTASDWQKCGAQPYELPPVEYWPNIVQSLRFVRDYVVPRIGPVEAVSAYRDPALNLCAKGAPESAHRYFQAVDLVPLKPTTREFLIHDLCALHADSGGRYNIGLGFYAYLRFHIDARKFRKWGAGDGPEAAACNAEPPSAAIAGPPLATTQPAATGAPSH